jgi:hypothetical protein
MKRQAWTLLIPSLHKGIKRRDPRIHLHNIPSREVRCTHLYSTTCIKEKRDLLVANLAIIFDSYAQAETIPAFKEPQVEYLIERGSLLDNLL